MKLTYQDKAFFALLQEEGLPLPVKEFQFYAPRKWKSDFAWPEQMLLLEVEGGVFTQGRHTRGSGFKKDMEKYNTAATLGYLLLRRTPSELLTLGTCQLIAECLKRNVA